MAFGNYNKIALNIVLALLNLSQRSRLYLFFYL